MLAELTAGANAQWNFGDMYSCHKTASFTALIILTSLVALQVRRLHQWTGLDARHTLTIFFLVSVSQLLGICCMHHSFVFTHRQCNYNSCLTACLCGSMLYICLTVRLYKTWLRSYLKCAPV